MLHHFILFIEKILHANFILRNNDRNIMVDIIFYKTCARVRVEYSSSFSSAEISTYWHVTVFECLLYAYVFFCEAPSVSLSLFLYRDIGWLKRQAGGITVNKYIFWSKFENSHNETKFVRLDPRNAIPSACRLSQLISLHLTCTQAQK